MASAAGLLSPGLVSLVKRAQNIRQEMDPGFLSSSENIFQSKSYSNYTKSEDIPQVYDNGKHYYSTYIHSGPENLKKFRAKKKTRDIK